VTIPSAFAALGAYRQFITYRLEPDPVRPGKTKKIPCQWNSGRTAERGGQIPSAWCSYDEAVAYSTLADVGYGHGVGFVFTAADPFWFVDVDGALLPDGSGWSDVATTICQWFPGAAYELSQSGTGFHLIGSGACPPHGCKNVKLGLELYTEQRFVALTFRDAQGDAGTDHSAALDALVPQVFPKSKGSEFVDWTTEPVEEWSGPKTDEALIAAACKPASSVSAAQAFGGAAGGASFKDLWEANADALAASWPSDKTAWDESHADMALATRLAYWTGKNCDRILRLMRESALTRDKWERPDYLERTIINACSIVSGVAHAKPEIVAPAEVLAVAETLANGWTGKMDKNDHLCMEAFIWSVLGGPPRYDEFADRILLPDGTEMTDAVENSIYFETRKVSTMPFAKVLFADAIRNMAWHRRFHPVRDYFDAVEAIWDGVPRIDTWLRDYASVDDTEFNRAVSSIFLRAAVRRVRVPGHKYDELLVLESPQGWDKSTLLAALCPREEWFTDEVHLGMDSKQLIEVTQGKLIVEMPELSKMGARDIESVKAMLARRRDKARLSYARTATEVGRQWVGGGNTNAEGGYLRDPTGNRRFYPVAMRDRAKVAAMIAVRDQLWAEAAVRDHVEPSIKLPSHLWAVAAELQADRMVKDSMFEDLSTLLDGLSGRVLSDALWDALRVGPSERRLSEISRGAALTRLGWKHTRLRGADGKRRYYYVKGDDAQQVRELTFDIQTRSLIDVAPSLSVVPG